MKIVETDEENKETGKDCVSNEHHDAKGEEEGSFDKPDNMIQEKVSSIPNRGRGRPRKKVDFSDSVKQEAASNEHHDVKDDVKDEDEVEGDADATGDMTQEKSPVVAPRGRGRPRRDESEIKSPLTEVDVKSELPRRGRGRPKKTVSTSDVIRRDPALPHRGRGRPPGIKRLDSSTLSASASATPRRGRGRPRKNPGMLVASTPLAKGHVGHIKGSKKMDAVKLLANALSNHGRGRPRKGTGIQDAVKLLKQDPAHPKVHSGRLPKSIKRMFAMKLLAKAMAIGSQDEAPKGLMTADVSKPLKIAISPNGGHRGRGRPKKITVEGTQTAIKKTGYLSFSVMKTSQPRGRPAKILAKPDGAAQDKVMKTARPRGRPPKVVKISSLPRGRPPKTLKTLGAVTVQDKAPGTAPRPRGRPRKTLASPDAAVPSDKASESEMESSEDAGEVLSEDEHVKSPVIANV